MTLFGFCCGLTQKVFILILFSKNNPSLVAGLNQLNQGLSLRCWKPPRREPPPPFTDPQCSSNLHKRPARSSSETDIFLVYLTVPFSKSLLFIWFLIFCFLPPLIFNPTSALSRFQFSKLMTSLFAPTSIYVTSVNDICKMKVSLITTEILNICHHVVPRILLIMQHRKVKALPEKFTGFWVKSSFLRLRRKIQRSFWSKCEVNILPGKKAYVCTFSCWELVLAICQKFTICSSINIFWFWNSIV